MVVTDQDVVHAFAQEVGERSVRRRPQDHRARMGADGGGAHACALSQRDQDAMLRILCEQQVVAHAHVRWRRTLREQLHRGVGTIVITARGESEWMQRTRAGRGRQRESRNDPLLQRALQRVEFAPRHLFVAIGVERETEGDIADRQVQLDPRFAAGTRDVQVRDRQGVRLHGTREQQQQQCQPVTLHQRATSGTGGNDRCCAAAQLRSGCRTSLRPAATAARCSSATSS